MGARRDFGAHAEHTGRPSTTAPAPSVDVSSEASARRRPGDTPAAVGYGGYAIARLREASG